MDFNSISNYYYYYQIEPVQPIIPMKHNPDSNDQKREDRKQESFTKILRRTQKRSKGK